MTLLLEDLLGRGYLPVQVRRGFSSATFANNLNHFQKAWDSGSPPATLGSDEDAQEPSDVDVSDLL